MKKIREMVSALFSSTHHQDPIAIIESLYRTIDGGYISQAERERLQINDTSFIYGEMLMPTFASLLAVVKPEPQEVFYDLGSGVGKTVIFAALLQSWRKCVGIELLPGLYQVSQAVLNNYHQQRHEEAVPLSPVEFVEGDFLQVSFADADVVHLNATTLNPVLWGELTVKLNQLKSGARVIVSTKKLDEMYFERLYQGVRAMSWGDCTVFIYRKR